MRGSWGALGYPCHQSQRVCGIHIDYLGLTMALLESSGVAWTPRKIKFERYIFLTSSRVPRNNAWSDRRCCSQAWRHGHEPGGMPATATGAGRFSPRPAEPEHPLFFLFFWPNDGSDGSVGGAAETERAVTVPSASEGTPRRSPLACSEMLPEIKHWAALTGCGQAAKTEHPGHVYVHATSASCPRRRSTSTFFFGGAGPSYRRTLPICSQNRTQMFPK